MSKPSFSLIISLVLIFILFIPVSGQTRTGKLGVGVDGSMLYLMGAGETNASAGLGGGINLSYSTLQYLGIRAKFEVGQLGWQTSGITTSRHTVVDTLPRSQRNKSITTDLMSLNVYLTANLMPNSNLNIFPLVGIGYVLLDPKLDNGTRNTGASNSDITINLGAGVDYFLNEFWSITVMGEYVLTGSPSYAGSNVLRNKDNDSFLRASIQIRYYFFDQAFIAKLLEAQRERSKRGK